MTEQEFETRKQKLLNDLDKLEQEAQKELTRLQQAKQKAAIELDACFLHYRNEIWTLKREMVKLGIIPEFENKGFV